MNTSIFDKLLPKELTSYFENLPPEQRPTYFGETLFPDAYTPELTLSFLRGRTPNPIALNLSSFDSQPPIRERFGFEKTWLELPFFREAMLIKEEEYSTLQRVNSGNLPEPYAESIIKRFYDDIKELLIAGLLQKEVMRMQLLGNAGRITLHGEGAVAEYDYEFPNENKFIPATAWSNTASADVIGDLYQWRKNIFDRRGVWPEMCILSETTWQYVVNNEAIRNGILLSYGIAAGTAGAVTNVNIASVQVGNYIRSRLDDGTAGSTNLKFHVYDQVYKPNSRAALTSIFPDNVISLIPDGKLGSTWWSDTPESLRDSDTRPGQMYTVAQTTSGITICQVDNIEPPITLKTWGSMISAPSFERINDCGWAQVV